jgi:hypothetical protein
MACIFMRKKVRKYLWVVINKTKVQYNIAYIVGGYY